MDTRNVVPNCFRAPISKFVFLKLLSFPRSKASQNFDCYNKMGEGNFLKKPQQIKPSPKAKPTSKASLHTKK